jgi:hypothetical protein
VSIYGETHMSRVRRRAKNNMRPAIIHAIADATVSVLVIVRLTLAWLRLARDGRASWGACV